MPRLNSTQNVLLLRSSSSPRKQSVACGIDSSGDSEQDFTDPYHGALSEGVLATSASDTRQTYHPFSIPVLETVTTPGGKDRIKSVVQSGPGSSGGQGYAGVIMTSARSAAVWTEVVKEIETDAQLGSAEEATFTWSSIPFYVVGKSTAAPLLSLHQPRSSGCRYPFLYPTNLKGAEETGTSEALAKFILRDLGSTNHSDSSPQRSLYQAHPSRIRLICLTGDKNKDTLPTILSTPPSERSIRPAIDLEEVQVYKTEGSKEFGSTLAKAVEETVSLPLNPGESSNGREDSQDWGWVVFFAPSASEYATPFLKDHFEFRQHTSPTPSSPSSSSQETLPIAETPRKLQCKVASIGPTTASFLQKKLNIFVDVVSPKPDPQSLAAALKDFDLNNPRRVHHEAETG